MIADSLFDVEPLISQAVELAGRPSRGRGRSRPPLADGVVAIQWPIDWEQELRLEKRDLLDRFQRCRDPEVIDQLMSLVDDHALDLEQARHWRNRVAGWESQLKRARRHPQCPVPFGRGSAA